MGVAWGIVEYGAERNRDEVIAGWREFGLGSDGFNVMHAADRIHFGHEEPVTIISDPQARAKVDALSTGDGTYDLFERMFDGFELFVPWDMYDTVKRPGCVADGLRAACVWDLRRNMAVRVEDFEPGSDAHRLASELHAAAELASELNMLIRVSF